MAQPKGLTMRKTEKPFPRHPGIYRVFHVDESGRQTPTSTFRVRKRIKINERWTTRVSTFETLDEAKTFLRQFNPNGGSSFAAISFDDALAKFMHYKEHEQGVGPGTIQGYRSRTRHFRFFLGQSMREITSSVIDQWVNLMLDPEYKALQLSSRIDYDHELVLLTGIFRFYREFIDESFTLPIMTRHRLRLCPKRRGTEDIRFLAQADEDAFLFQMERYPMQRDLALLQLHTGARVGEAAALEFKDIDFKRGFIHLRQHLLWPRSKGGQTRPQAGTKGGPSRTVDLTRECAEMLRKRLENRSGSIVFPDPKTNSWLSYRSIQHVYDCAFERAGLDYTGTHTLRHTFAVRFLDQTKDIYALQKLLGHKDLEQTQVYAKYSNAAVTRSFQLFRGGKEENHEVVPNLVPKITGI